MNRIGIDVGGTNTDLIHIKDNQVIFSHKTSTTKDIITGIKNSLNEYSNKKVKNKKNIDAVMIGTTHFINAIVQRKNLNRVAALRICLPSSKSLPPFVDWPDHLVKYISGKFYLVNGGHEYDGRELSHLDQNAIEKVGLDIQNRNIRSLAITSVFSPLTSEHEELAAKIIREINPNIQITLSSKLGRIGLLERENAALLNASLIELADESFLAFKQALEEFGMIAPLYITQNDGTVVNVEQAKKYPILCLASGPTNSMRGAAFLSNIKNAIVCDIGGTTSDIGCLKDGFPRQANNAVEIGGVRTLFRMPELISIGLGGGTLIKNNPVSVGPESVGHNLVNEALVYGGNMMTLTDFAVASNLIELGDVKKVLNLSKDLLNSINNIIYKKLYENFEKIRIDSTPLPLIIVGGGSMLAPKSIQGITEVVQVKYNEVANAVGAAISQVSGEVDRIYRDMNRKDAMSLAENQARVKAIDSGADENSLNTIELEDLPLAYLPGNAMRIRVRVVGNII